MFIPCEMPRESEWGTVASLSVDGEMLSTNLWELLWRRFRGGGRELGVAASTVWLFTSGCLVPGVCFCCSATSSLHPPPASSRLHLLWHHKALVLTYVPHSTIGTLYGSEKEQKKTNKRGNEETHTLKKKKKQNTSTGNTGQPRKLSGLQLAIVLRFDFNTCVGLFFKKKKKFSSLNSGGIWICKRTQG